MEGGSIPPIGNHTMIKKVKSKYVVLSETTGRSFGTYQTLKEAKNRLRQIEFFKHRAQKRKRITAL